jgi:hypothetical protein
VNRADLKLIPAEFEAGGPFYDLHCWLNDNAKKFGFFRPYDLFRGGIQPEPWHLSFAAVSVPALEGLTCNLLERVISAAPIEGRDVILARLDEIHGKYVRNVSPSLLALV